MRSTWLLGAVFASAFAQANGIEPAAASTIDYFSRDTFRIDSYVCPFRNDIDYEPGEIECGLLQVPENREKPDSRYIELRFVKLSSTWDDEEGADDDSVCTFSSSAASPTPVTLVPGTPHANRRILPLILSTASSRRP